MQTSTIAPINLLAYSSDFERDFITAKTKSARAGSPPSPEGAAGSLLGGNLITTAQGMSRQDKRHVNACVRYAQWYASRKRDRDADPQGWFSAFAVALWTMGWEYEDGKVIEKQYANFSGKLSRSYMNTIAGVNSRMAKVTQEMFDVLLVNKSALASLSKESRRGREFAIAPAEYDQQGRLTLNLNDYSLRAQAQREDFLFWDWNEGNVTLTHRAVPFTLNRSTFEKHRPELNDRLDLIADAIFEFYPGRT